MMIDLAHFPSNFVKTARAAVFGLASVAFFYASTSVPTFARSKQAPPASEEGAETKSDSKTRDKSAKTTTKDQKGSARDAKSPNDGKIKEVKTENGYGKSEQIGSFADWGAYATPGKDRTCYAMSQPKDRQPKAKLKDTSAYVFVSMRPGEGVKNEVAINLGFPAKENGPASASIDEQEFELVTKGTNAWLKNAAEEDKFVKAVKSGGKLIVKASSAKGTSTVDAYSLKGFSQALDRAQKECR